MLLTPLFTMLLAVAGSLSAAPALEVAEAGYQTLAEERQVDGVIEAVHRSTVSAQTAGEIVTLPFDVNDFVPKGALVFGIDDTRQKAELAKALANEAKAQARLKEANTSHQRNLRLIKDNAVSQSQLDESEADLKTARAQLDESVAALEQAREQLDYTAVKAPFDGVMVERLVELGEQVQTGTPLGTGLSLEKLRVKAELPASHAQAVREQGRARVQISADHWIETEQLTFFPYADPESHSITVRVELPEGQYGLYPGMLVKVAFVVGEEARLVVPTTAIVHRSEVVGVYVLAGEQGLQFRQLRIGRQTPNGGTEVLAGLEAGEQVALDPVAAVIRLKQTQAEAAHE
jgi:RND family efflux transporter MFP subunit